MKIAITGGTGFVGSGLIDVLLKRGDNVQVVTRDPGRLPVPFHGLVETVKWEDLDLSGVDAVVHLAGENVFGRRWNATQKEEIRRSRVESTERIVGLVEQAQPAPKVLVSASAIGYYGPHDDDGELSEDSPAGNDFLAGVAAEGEKVASQARKGGCRVVPVRIGIVLEGDGGALARMVTPFKLFVGGPVGHGRQWFSWIHRKDLARLLVFPIEKEDVDEPLNGTAPNPVRMKEFCKALGKALGRPSWLPAPAFALRLALGEVSEVIVKGQRVVPARAQALGFEFEFPKLEKALDDILTEEVVP